MADIVKLIPPPAKSDRLTAELTMDEALIIFSLRKGYARSPELILSLAGKPWTAEERKKWIENNTCEDEEAKKARELQAYNNYCEITGEPQNLKRINKIIKKWEAKKAEEIARNKEICEQTDARYAEFLKAWEERKLY